MLYEIEIPQIVVNDINELSDYIYRFSFDIHISRKIYDDLYQKIFSLNFLPNRYETYVGIYKRIVVQGSYKILYRIDEENKKVIIVRVLRNEQNNFDL